MLSNFGHRVYAVTERNKWFGAVLATLIVTQFITAIYMTVKSALTPCKSFGSSFARRQTHVVPSATVARYKPRPIQGLYYCVESTSGDAFPQCWHCLRYVITVSHLGNSDGPHIPHPPRRGSPQRLLRSRRFF